MKTQRPILMVEDDEIDAMTVQRALREIHVTNRLIHVGNGAQALEYLNDPHNEVPVIILLDLRMPGMTGIEFLEVRRHDDHIRMIPVIVLTTSTEEQDKVDSYRLGVAGYLRKPVDYLQFVEIVRTIDLYWTLCELPGVDT